MHRRAGAVRRTPRKAPRPVFEIEGLHIDYTTELGVLHAVRDVSLTVHEHESFGLVGESGSGKSTLAMGAIRYLATNGKVTDGSVRLNGVELLGLPAKELRELWGSRIGVVYQSPLSALNPSISHRQAARRGGPPAPGHGPRGGARRASARCWPRSPCPIPRRS